VLVTVEQRELVDQDRSHKAKRAVSACPLVGTTTCTSKIDLKFSEATLRNMWKTLLTSTPQSVCG
jgi:hypothetical protein